MGNIFEALGGYFRQLRKEKGLSLQEVARRSGLSPSHLSRIERGIKGTSLEVLLQIGKGLGLSPEELSQVLATSVIKCFAPSSKDLEISEKPAALLVSSSGYWQQKYPLEFEIIKKKLQNLCERIDLKLSEPVITAKFTPLLEKKIEGSALLFDLTGVFRGGLLGFPRHPLTPATLCALQNRIPYFLLFQNKEKRGYRIVGWINKYYSEEFVDIEQLFNSLERILSMFKKEILRWYSQRMSLKSLEEAAILYDLSFSSYSVLKKLINEGKLSSLSRMDWEKILTNLRMPLEKESYKKNHNL